MGREEAPTAGAVRSLVTKFEEHGSVVDKIRVGRPQSVRTHQNIAVVTNSVDISTLKSTRRRSQELGMSVRTIRRLLNKDLHMYPYKI